MLAKPGDSIEISSGTYYENLEIKKGIALLGKDTGSGMPIIDARNKGCAIKVDAYEFRIAGIFFQNSPLADIYANTDKIYLVRPRPKQATSGILPLNNTTSEFSPPGFQVFSGSDGTTYVGPGADITTKGLLTVDEVLDNPTNKKHLGTLIRSSIEDAGGILIYEGDPSVFASAPTEKLLFSDDFSDINSGWSKKSSDPEEGSLGYKNGEYVIAVFQKNKATSAWLTRSFRDFVIEVEATQEGGPDDNDYGVILRQIDKNNYYRFKISGNGYYGFDKWQGGEWTNIIPWTRSTAINTGMATNLMKAECNGDKFTFYANGVKLGDCTDDSFADGNIGLIAGTHDEGGVKISFDNLKVWAMD